jgi:hypothetical protein
LSLRLTLGGESFARETNGIALPIAADPVIAADAGLGLPAVSVVRAGSPQVVTVTIRTRPQVRLGQRPVLSLDGVSAEAQNARGRERSAGVRVSQLDSRRQPMGSSAR